jgi:hypothetical protein
VAHDESGDAGSYPRQHRTTEQALTIAFHKTPNFKGARGSATLVTLPLRTGDVTDP